MNKQEIERALKAYEDIDATLTFIRNMMDEPDELVIMNIASFKSDIDAMIKDIRINGVVTKQALQSAQSYVDPDTIVIKRSELEAMKVNPMCGDRKPTSIYIMGYRQAIDHILKGRTK